VNKESEELMGNRKQITLEQMNEAMLGLEIAFSRTIKEKGPGAFASRHELLGVITEEYWELENTVTNKDFPRLEGIKDELLAIAVACVFGVACIDANGLE